VHTGLARVRVWLAKPDGDQIAGKHPAMNQDNICTQVDYWYTSAWLLLLANKAR
jgi:hypothetical protein